MEKITFDVLTIEVTRRCNMACAHCLRGDAQQKDINHKEIDALLDQTLMIGKLILTGGEPSLVPETMEYIAESLINKGIPLLKLEIYTNGLVFSNQFVKAIKRFREIIDASCKHGFDDKEPYIPALETGRCYVGVSLDRYHTDHDICESHYKQYKKELSGKADVLRIMRGNAPVRVGRATCLSDTTYDKSVFRSYDPLRRVEILDKQHIPICSIYDRFRLIYDDQRIVCCNLCLSADGNIRHGNAATYSYAELDAFPIICRASDDIWTSILTYNQGRNPCVQIENEILRNHLHDRQIMQTALQFSAAQADAQDELSEKAKYETFKSVVSAVKNGATTKRQIRAFQINEMMQSEMKDWEDIAAKSAERLRGGSNSDSPALSVESRPAANGSMSPLMSALAITALIKLQRQAEKQIENEANQLRCRSCGKVIQYNGRNIHCTKSGDKLKCEYCGKTTMPGTNNRR